MKYLAFLCFLALPVFFIVIGAWDGLLIFGIGSLCMLLIIWSLDRFERRALERMRRRQAEERRSLRSQVKPTPGRGATP